MDCKHFGICGGCLCEPATNGLLVKPIPYMEEVQEKEKRVRKLLQAYEVEEWRPIILSPDEWHYRNKMEYAFSATTPLADPPGSSGGAPGPILGLRQAGHFDRIVDLETCFLMSPESIELLKQVRQWARSAGLTGYDRRRHEGDLRHLVIREGKNTGQRMAVLIASVKCQALYPGKVPGTLLPDLQGRISSLITTCWLGVTDARGDVARADDMRLLWGPGTIEERLGTVTYRISPYSFFQTNTHGTEKLYELLKEWSFPSPCALSPGRGEGEGALLDLYCGSGGITLALAGGFDRVIGIDTNAGAIQDAKANAERNGIGNAEFACEDVLDFLKKLPASKLAVQLAAIVVDPPRVGLHPQALRALLEINPQRLAYVSCNPESLARDLQSLVPFYRIRSAQAVDLFPHTPHVETLAILEHR